MTPAFAYRLESADRSVVISEESKPYDALIRLARGADVLVHEVVWPARQSIGCWPMRDAAALKKSILSHHTPAVEVGHVETRWNSVLGVLPADDPRSPG